MKILSLETSAKSASAAVVEDGNVLASCFQCTGLTHSRTLMPMVEAMLKNAELTLSQMDALAVAAGPGSFTGLRIGVSALKGLAWAADKPCLGVSTLEAMAHNLAHMDALLICAMDARRHQIYNAIFEARGGSLTRLCPDRAIALEEVREELRGDNRRKIVLGDGALLCYDDLSKNGISCELAPAALRWQNAVGVALAAQVAYARGEACTAQALRPVYLRISQAERERSARLQKQGEQN
ncbi:MAG: tRNA (adenosine(37)-N6)-threonylcarbamoyltransferase complex dimerization subunit type 1 TsaB [Oscillospiraceae bacterium]|nr:tRNA (adenosine(37)-N6)-threonylcarbamoyltransferase complex dimerization subunit type 1 TsaB [Oscillospiraceae bacterium]